MDIIRQYDTFKEKCFGFSSEFESRYFKDAKFICHPTVENELISVCSEAEAKSNGLNICRMADMLLMSDDNESWETFNLAKAREMALENGYIYLTDLLGESSFYAEEWMISGKKDTVVISEEYMREKGMQYAPVTPLTNCVLHFKKTKGEFFWKKAPAGEVISINDDYIKECLDSYMEKCASEIPSFASNDDLTFTLFGSEVSIDAGTTRALKTDVFFEHINNILATLADVRDVFEASEYDFNTRAYIVELAAKILGRNGVNISEDDFRTKYISPIASLDESELEEELAVIPARCDDAAIDIIKLAFAKAMENADFDYSYPAAGGSSYSSRMRELEQGDYNDAIDIGEEKYLISSVLSSRPDDYAIFAYTLRRYPEEEGNLAKFADFWGISPVSEQEMQHIIFNSYLTADLFDESGNFISGIEQAQIIKDELEKVNVKYGFTDRKYIDELGEYIKDADLRSRSYNGTVFDTPEDMKRAVANELELQALCIDLSALDEGELVDLKKHIEGITIDEATKAKYLVKVKVAMNRCEESMLEQRCLGLPMMNADETIQLRNEVEKSGYAESVVRPKMADIINHLDISLKAELDKKFSEADISDHDDVMALLNSLKSGRYPPVMAESYLRKIDEAVDNHIKSEIAEICNGMDSFTMDELTDAKTKLLSSGYPEKYTYAAVNEINSLMADFEKNEVAALFANIDFATSEELDHIRNVLDVKNYPDELIAPYSDKIEQREQELLDEELTLMCESIEEMEQEALVSLRERINTSDKAYNEELKEKNLERILHREAELKNTELAERCKYIFSMEQPALDELKDVLLSGKYDESITTVYLKKITEREDELRCEELDKMCENIGEMDIEALEALKDEIAADESYVAISDKYFEKIDICIDNIRNAEFNALLATVADMDSDALQKFVQNMKEEHENGEIDDAAYEKSLAKADERSDAIEIETLDAVIEGIDGFTIEQAEKAEEEIRNSSCKNEYKQERIDKLEDKIEELTLKKLDEITADADDLDKSQLLEVKKTLEEYRCPAELKMTYIHSIDKKIEKLAEKEISDICGNVSTLSVKKSLDAMVKIRALSIDDAIKNKYLDSVESHIMDLRNGEQRDYILFLKQKIAEFNVSTVSFLVPTLSNLFYPKYEEVCKNYVSPGRYELPIFLHDNSAESGFTLTTDYFYAVSKGVLNRIKIDDIVSFQAKKSFVSVSIVVSERNGNTSEIPCSINKNTIDATAKAMTALVNYIHEQRSAERMQEMLETAVNERTQEIAIAAAAAEQAQAAVQHDSPAEVTPAPEVKPEPAEETAEASEVTEAAEIAEVAQEEEAAPVQEEPLTPPSPIPEEAPKIRFCDQCGAKIGSATAKFCAECGNKLS